MAIPGPYDMLALGGYVLGSLSLLTLLLHICDCFDDGNGVKKLLSLRNIRDIAQRLSFLLNGRTIIARGYQNGQGEPFKVKTPSNDLVVVTTKRHLSEISSAPHSELSLHAVATELLQPKHTMQGFQWHEERGVEGTGFVRALRSNLTANLQLLQPQLTSTIVGALDEYMEKSPLIEGGAEIHVFDAVKSIVSKANCLMFFGERYASNPEFVDSALQYCQDVIYTAEILRMVPKYFRSSLAALMRQRQRSSKQLFGYLIPEVSQRMAFRSRAHGTPEYTKSVPRDCVQWLIDTSPLKQPWTSQRMAHEIMAIWFSSIHQLAMVLTWALEDLCLHPEYVEPLRAEIEACTSHLKDSTTVDQTLDLSKLEVLESFISESSRTSPLDAVSVRRKALIDFKFSDGTLVSKGDWVCCALDEMMSDPQYWPEANTFNGFRFASSAAVRHGLDRHSSGNQGGNSRPFAESSSTSSSNIKFTDVGHPWVMWGSGDKSCPGRFYSSMILKIAMVTVLQRYNCSLKARNAPRSFQWRTSIVPRMDVAMIVHPR